MVKLLLIPGETSTWQNNEVKREVIDRKGLSKLGEDKMGVQWKIFPSNSRQQTPPKVGKSRNYVHKFKNAQNIYNAGYMVLVAGPQVARSLG